MKKLSLLLVILTFVSINFSFAVTPKLNLDINKPKRVYYPELKPEIFGEIPTFVATTKDNSSQSSIVKVGDLTDAVFTLYNKGTHLVYEPKSGTLLLLYNNMKVSGTSISGGTLQLVYSQDLGNKWAARNIYDGPDYQGYFISFMVANNKGTNNVNDFQYMTQSWNYKSPNYSTDYTSLFNISGASQSYSQIFQGPEVNNTVTGTLKDYKWEGLGFTSYVDSKGNSYAYSASHPYNRTSNSSLEVAKYAFLGWSFNDEDFTKSSLPTEWANSQFSAPLGAGVGAASSGYSSPINIQVDSEGSLYAAVCNFFPDDAESRVPSVSKSIDKGVTWSKFDANKVPSSLVLDIAKAQWTTGTTDNVTAVVGGARPYEGNAFVVTGKDEYSFVYRVYANNTTKNESKLLMVETSYKNKVWTAVKIAELNGIPDVLTFNGTTATSFPNRYRIDSDDNGNEVELAKTKDGAYIVLKYIDYDTKRGPIALSKAIHVIQDQGTQAAPKDVDLAIDTLFTTDIMLAYRAVGSSSWNTPVNATNDLNYQKVSMMPSIVPSISQVPLMWLETNKLTATSKDSAAFFPDIALQMVCDARLDQGIKYLTGDATQIRSSVNDENPVVANGFTLNAIYPNPVTNDAEISFSLSNDGLTKLEVFNTIGQRVAVLANDIIGAGLHAVNFNTAGLTAGVYYYTLTVNGQSITKVANIVK